MADARCVHSVGGSLIATSPGEVSTSLPEFTAITTLTQNILGAGILALPYAFRSAGIVGGLCLFALTYVLSVVSMVVLVKLSKDFKTFTYREAAEHSLGWHWPLILDVWVFFFSFGICTGYAVMLGDFLFDLGDHFGAGALNSKVGWMAIAIGCVCWPLSCASSLGALRWMSILGVAGIFFSVVAVIKRYSDGIGGPGRNDLAAFNTEKFGDSFPILVGAFGAHYNIPGLYKEVAPPGGQAEVSDGFYKMMRVIIVAVSISTLVYGVAGCVVFATFGPFTKSDCSTNYDSHDYWIIVLRMMMTLAICASFPLVMVPCRNSVLRWCTCECMLARNSMARVVVTTALTFLCFILAAVAGNVGTVLDYNGSVFGTPVCYIAPTAMYLCLPRDNQTWYWRLMCMACIVSGVAFGLLGVMVVSSETGRTHWE